MPENPKVFISYSHDSPEHKRWVSELGAKLPHNGIDAILDQWDLGPGDDITRFMESGLKNSDRVLVVCTDTYVSKANAGEGGVGYERMIVNAQLIQNLGTNKFIPVIRHASGEEMTPTFLATRMYIDLRDQSEFETEFNKLLHELHHVPIIQKPPLGKNPFATLPSGQEVLSSEGVSIQLPKIPQEVQSSAEAYSAAL
ncbi:MAG: toll/interleukin-1 receptor domain-containing protein, partial [Candidatus Poribacteria bacterium]|nr:toll/interleukin-1 receptor domain-containing protein [Candidatus Poribacteria bacterium]